MPNGTGGHPEHNQQAAAADLTWPPDQVHLNSDLDNTVRSQLRKAGITEETGHPARAWVDITFDCFNTDDTTDTETY